MKRLIFFALLAFIALGPLILQPARAVICNLDPNSPTLIEIIGMEAGQTMLVDYNAIDPDGRYSGQKLTARLMSAPVFVTMTTPARTVAPDPNTADCEGAAIIAADSNGLALRFICSPNKGQAGAYSVVWEIDDGSGTANATARYSFSLIVNRVNHRPFIHAVAAKNPG